MKPIWKAAAAALAVTTLGCSTLVGPGDDLSRKVDYLRQDVEALTAQQKALAEQIAALGTSPRPAAAAASAEVAPTAPAAAEDAAREASRDAANIAADPSALYKRAFDLMESGKLDEAEAAFGEFIGRFPQSDLADNAQYWMGECLYGQKSFKEARDAFKAVSDHFPFGNKVPDALYKQALCERELGDAAAAAETLKRLTEFFPDSEAAAKARAAKP